ncbi:MAG: hypothetical protein QF681_15155 [Vicinamibacterales bacterium]|nr:hypothetical protein [Vicinamibacterales bacterium]
MTLQRFQRLTAGSKQPDLRRAMSVALTVEVPHNLESYARFYSRVVQALGELDGESLRAVGESASATPASNRSAIA